MSLSSLKYLTKQGLSNLGRNRMMSIASIGVLTACLAITGIAALLGINVSGFVDYLGAQNKVIVYMKLDASDEVITSAQTAIEKTDNVGTVTFVSKDAALEEAKQWITEYDNGAYSDVLNGYEGANNPLYASFRVTVSDLNKLDATVAKLSAVSGVDFVNSPSELAGTLVSLKRTVNLAGWCLVAVLAVVSLVVINNTIRITVYARRKEIGIMKFVGATNGFIRFPFLVEGMFIGLIAACCAFGVVTAAYLGVLQAIRNAGTGLLFNLYFTILPYGNVWRILLGAFILSGVLVGGIGSTVSLHRHLKV